MKIWVDPERFPPKGFIWSKSVNITKGLLNIYVKENKHIEKISIAKSAGEYARDGGSYDQIYPWILENNIKVDAIEWH